MKKAFAISALLLFSILVRGQSLSENAPTNFVNSEAIKIGLVAIPTDDLAVIRIWQSDYQVLELRQSKEGQVTGLLINYVTKVNRRDKPIKVIKEVILVAPDDAKHLFTTLIDQGITQIKDASEIDDYPVGLDGKTTTLEVYVNQLYRVTSYWELENEQYHSPQNPDIQEVKAMLELVKSRVSWWPLFKRFRDQLGPGAYRYGGINMVKLSEFRG